MLNHIHESRFLNHVLQMRLDDDLFAEARARFAGERPLGVEYLFEVVVGVVGEEDGTDFGMFDIAARGKVTVQDCLEK